MGQKTIISEVNRMREIMGLGLLNEQDEELFGPIGPEYMETAAGDAVTEDENAFKTIHGGKPYELFLEKSSPKSKLYLESTGEETTVSLKYKYRRKHPHLVIIEKIEETIEGLDTTAKNYENRLQKLQDKIENYTNRYENSLTKKNARVDKDYQYTSSKDSVKKQRKTDNPYEENPDYVEGSIKLKTDLAITPLEKLNLMDRINNYVEKHYDGDYTAAADTKKRSKKTSYSRIFGIEKIEINPKNIKTVKGEAPVIKIYPGLESKLEGIDEGTKKIFKDNSWEVGEMIEEYAQGVIDDLNAMKQQYEADGYTDITFEMTTKGADEDGNPINVPFTISTSASRIPNGGQAKDLTFLELSEKRAQSTIDYLRQVWGAAGIKMIEPIIDFQGDGKVNKDGSTGGASGHEWDGDTSASNRERYESSKYCNIDALFLLKAPGFEEQEDPGTPDEEKVGEWYLYIKKKTKGRPVKTFIRKLGDIWFKLKQIRLPKIKLPKRNTRRKIPCYGLH